MSTKQITKGSRNVTVNVPVDDYLEIARLCRVSNAKMSDYGRALFAFAIKHDLVAGPNADDYERWIDAIKDGSAPLPKVTLEIKAGAPSKLSLFEGKEGEASFLRVADEPARGRKSGKAGLHAGSA